MDRPEKRPQNTRADFKWQHLPQISRSYRAPSTFNHNAPGTNAPVKQSKVVKQRVSLCSSRRREETQVPCVQPAYKTTHGPCRQEAPIDWRTSRKTHLSKHTHIQHYTHTHTQVDKICQVSSTALRERADLWRPGESNTQLTNRSFSITHTRLQDAELHRRLKIVNHRGSRCKD